MVSTVCGQFQAAEKFRCLILILWENTIMAEEGTDRKSGNISTSFFWYLLSPVWQAGVTDDWENNFTMDQSEDFDKVFQEKLNSLDLSILPGPETLNIFRFLRMTYFWIFSSLLLM